ncbi:MAG TPA: YoaK family protein [Acidimicrobiales bacterium]|nr:YoaK family protein [Acidimicrobiales bacterium]
MAPTETDGPATARRLALAGLFLLAATTGLVDATAYLGLGRVFTANMTGNVLLLGFSTTTRPGGELDTAVLYGSLAALLAFVAGALVGALAAGRRDADPRVARGFGLEWALLAAASGLLFYGGATSGVVRYLVLVLLGLSMGVQNAAVRRMGVPDVNTTVLTTALAGLASDVVAVAGRPARAGRRVATVVFLFLGAAAGAALEHQQPRWSAVGALFLLTVSVGLVARGGLLQAAPSRTG